MDSWIAFLVSDFSAIVQGWLIKVKTPPLGQKHPPLAKKNL